ncbi:MAG: DUF4389 domain-containing protein [Thermoleophilaceae bacterium]|nr:DUF4389 domain-containing protein [Thermoleophilaceae bacterium]
MNETPPPPPEGTVPPPPPPPAGGPHPPPPPPTLPPAGTISTGPEPYPVDLTIEYQDRELNRTTTFFRLFTLIPILILVTLIADATARYGDSGALIGTAGGLLVLPTAVMIIFKEKYPRWWFDFNKQLTAFFLRVGVYALLIEDRYPSTDDPQGVELTLEYPNVTGELNRFMPLIKWFLAIPHYFVLFFLGIGVFFATIYAWFVILFTGRYPKDLFEFVEGVLRWYVRVSGYTSLLVTDRYPPFRLGH